ncbi:hypothetical protein CMK13_01755, partial [Candidatus Poribacteria bacterium]
DLAKAANQQASKLSSVGFSRTSVLVPQRFGLIITAVSKDSFDLDDWSVLRLRFRCVALFWQMQSNRLFKSPR